MLKIIIERIKTLKCVVLRRETASFFTPKSVCVLFNISCLKNEARGTTEFGAVTRRGPRAEFGIQLRADKQYE